MGKIRRVRTKRHIEAVKNNLSEDNNVATDFLPNEVFGKYFVNVKLLSGWAPCGVYHYRYPSNLGGVYEKEDSRDDCCFIYERLALSFQSNLPALFPISNLFELVQENTKTDEATNVGEDGGGINNEEDKSSTKKNKRKLRHEKFLKSKNFLW
jgi:hypothetical protein